MEKMIFEKIGLKKKNEKNLLTEENNFLEKFDKAQVNPFS